MPCYDFLNATPTDPLNPDYGWQKKRPVTHLTTKANAGPSYMREITDVGHQFMLNWGTTIDSAKSEADILRLKRYYEQYRDGFFTLVDQEGAAKRNFVGRFVNPVEPVNVGHNRWAAQGVLFEEVPGAPMVNYPGDWDNDAIWRYVVNDFDEIQPAVDDFANWTLGATGSPGSATGTPSVGGNYPFAGFLSGEGELGPYAASGFGLSAPAGATIIGIALTLRREIVTGPYLSLNTASVQLTKNGVPVGTPKSNLGLWGFTPVIEGYGETDDDLWGTGWTSADLPGLGVLVTVHYINGIGGDVAFTLDDFQIIVFYSTASVLALSSDVADAWAQLTYVGWGCQVWQPTGPSFGIADITLDGADQGTIDGYSAVLVPSAPMMTIQSVPLGIHRLRITVTGTKNDSSSDYICMYDALKVMR